MAKNDQPTEHATLAEALLAAQEEMPAVDRDKENPHFQSAFTSLDNLLSKTRPILNQNGLVLTQGPDLEDGQLVLRTIIMHSSGERLSFAAPLAPAKNDPQGQGAAITYMRRYSAAAVLAIADQEDDDGQRSSGGRQELEALEDEQATKLKAEAEGIRDEIRNLDPDALPEQSFQQAIQNRAHSHDLLQEFVGKLRDLLADIQRCKELEAELALKLSGPELQKVTDRAKRKGSRAERVEVLEKALAETEGSDDVKA